jgi:uncharacterized ubiquitin-like protein YukD
MINTEKEELQIQELEKSQSQKEQESQEEEQESQEEESQEEEKKERLPLTNNINLQLGDIIQFDAPTDTSLHDKIYFIKFINQEKIVLINAEKTITLNITPSGKLEEESIANILLLSRHKSPSFIAQNNLEMKKYISIYFGEPIPKVLNGIITNIENDMIEITTLPEKELLYIDFAYSGIPEHLNIEKIIVREKVDETKLLVSREEKLKSLDSDTISEESYLNQDDTQELDYDLKVYDAKSDLENIIIDTIELGEELDDLEHEVNVSEGEQRYSLDKQTNDYLDKLINAYLPEQRTEEVINKIHNEINYYVQLRTLYSHFDANNNPSLIEDRGQYYKHLKEQLFNLNKKLYYILPVLSNVRNLIINETTDADTLEDNDAYNYQHLGEFIETLNTIALKWANNSSKEKINTYKEHIKSLIQLLDNYSNYSEQNINVNTQIEMVNSIVDDFYNYSITKGELSKSRFVIDVYSEGLNMLETYYVNNKKFNKISKLVPNDFVNIIGFITLPLPLFNFSKINSPYTNICDRANLNLNFINYHELLNKNTLYNKYVLENSNKDAFINSHATIHNNRLLQTINNFTIDESLDLPYLEKMNYLLESFIPTNSSFIKEYIGTYTANSLENRKYNLLEFVYDLQALNIDVYNLHVTDYKAIKKIINSNIDYYKKNYKYEESNFSNFIRTIKDAAKSSERGANINYSFSLLTKELKDELFNFYKIAEENLNNSEELYSYIVKIDSAEFFMQSVNKNIMDLIVGNLLENFIKAYEKEKDKDKTKEQDETKADAQQVSSKDILKGELDSMQNTCEKYVLSKKYTTLQSLENDNNKLIYFDSIYDNTFYSILNDYKTERATMDTKQFTDFLTNKLMTLMNLTKVRAFREAKAIIDEKREIVDGDYAILVDKGSAKNYVYIRTNDAWMLDPKFEDNFYIESNQIFCDSNKECISKDDKCVTLADAQKANVNKEVDEILKTFESKYDLSIEDIKGKINTNYENSKARIQAINNINKTKRETINNYLLSLEDPNISEENKTASPYIKLRDGILKMKDIAFKYSTIKKFCINFTREAIKDESPYILYCIKTGQPLIPLFLLKLANAFINKLDFVKELDYICAEQGTLSDDNNYWVDKYSGYIIKSIEFNSDEGYDEKGYKLQTRALLENEYTISPDIQVTELTKSKSLNPNTQIILNIIKAMSLMIGINIVHNHELIINNVLTIQNSSIPTKKQYDEILLKSTKKEGKVKAMPSYEETYNSSLLLLTLTFIIYVIQINIPSLTSKKTFPGCIKSFKGYPLDGEEDKTTIAYVACIANKIKSSITPWNSILKMSESTIIKKIEALIERYIITSKDLAVHLNKKREYLLSTQVVDDAIPEYLSINNWHTFNPPLYDIKISSENISSIDDGFKTTLYETFSRGEKNNIKEIIESKAIFSSYYIIERIQNVVKKNTPLLKNSNDNPFLENACCNSSKNTSEYFMNEDNSIETSNKQVAFYNNILNSIDLLTYAPQLYNQENTKQKIISQTASFSEELVYKAFIYFCNFANLLPIDDELKGLCLDKPTQFDNNKQLKEIIESLKSEGKVYNFSSFVELIHIISKKNIIHISTNYPIINNIELMRVLIEAYTQNSYYKLDDELISKLESLLDDFSIVSSENLELRNFKNYLGKSLVGLKQNILQIISKQSNISKSDFAKFSQNLELTIDVENTKFYQNYIMNFLYIFPSIMLNKNVNYGAIPKHWKLSDIHNKDIYNIIQKYYNNINNFNARPELIVAFKIISKKCKILLELMPVFLYNKFLVSDYSSSKTLKINSIFDEKVVILFYTYVFYTLYYELLTINDSPEFLLTLQDLQINDYDKGEFLKNSVNYILEYSSTMNNHYNLINNGYKKVKDKINMAKEKEKDLITDFLKNLSDEEREIENILKNNKLEKWNKGMQKGITQYVKENYDEEREAMEKQAIKEKKLQQNNNVTAMNKELYDLALDEQTLNDHAIDTEEYSMNNIPDDDDFDYENGEDGDYANGPNEDYD